MDPKKVLQAEKSRVEQQLHNTRERFYDVSSSIDNELSTFDQHPADSGAELYEQEATLGITSSLEATLRNIDASLQMVDKGEYGVCTRCSRPIGVARLQALPYASLCIDCARELESGATAPSEEKVLNFSEISEKGQGFTVAGETFYQFDGDGTQGEYS
ncbi:MAG: TraR/DksA C4-type zinc finger protein [Methylocystaceae bacterium]